MAEPSFGIDPYFQAVEGPKIMAGPRNVEKSSFRDGPSKNRDSEKIGKFAFRISWASERRKYVPCNQSALLVQNAKRENSAKNFFLKISSFISSANLLTGQEHYDTTVID